MRIGVANMGFQSGCSFQNWARRMLVVTPPLHAFLCDTYDRAGYYYISGEK